MPKLVIQGATLACSMGTAPASFAISPSRELGATDADAGNVDDHLPNTNVVPFGMCQSLTNPQVSTATAAALGVLTPQPCVPVLPQPWSPGSTSVEIAGRPGLHDGCTCACAWGGTISVTNAGQGIIDV